MDTDNPGLAMIDLDEPNQVILGSKTEFAVSNTVGDAEFGGLYCKGIWNGNTNDLLKTGVGKMTLKITNTPETTFGKIQIAEGEVVILKQLYADSITKEGACSVALTSKNLAEATTNAVQLTGKLSADIVNLFVPSYSGNTTWYGGFVAGSELSKAKKCHVFIRDDEGTRLFDGYYYRELEGVTIDNKVTTEDGRVTYGVTLPYVKTNRGTILYIYY